MEAASPEELYTQRQKKKIPVVSATVTGSPRGRAARIIAIIIVPSLRLLQLQRENSLIVKKRFLKLVPPKKERRPRHCSLPAPSASARKASSCCGCGTLDGWSCGELRAKPSPIYLENPNSLLLLCTRGPRFLPPPHRAPGALWKSLKRRPQVQRLSKPRPLPSLPAPRPPRGQRQQRRRWRRWPPRPA